MATSKLSSKDDFEIRFNAWVKKTSSEILEFQSIADSAVVAAVGGSIDWTLVEIAFRNRTQAVNLQKILDDALRVRELKSNGK